uniref:Uncharacterized protein n=1 Tax=Syphacia muris TaxID=451379 RepID=A0A0N5ASI2_9BILA
MSEQENIINLGKIGKLFRVSDDIHRMTEFVMELRIASLVIGIVIAFGALIYLIAKIGGKIFRHRRKCKKRYESMIETLSRINAQQGSSLAPYSGQDVWYSRREKRGVDADNNVYASSVHVPLDSLDEMHTKTSDLKEANANS